MPSLSSLGPTERPGQDRSTMKAVMPLWPLEKSVLAKTTNRPASLELEIQHLVPSITHSPAPSSHVALVLRAKASDPLFASVRQKLHTVSVQSLVRNLSLCCGVPYRMNEVISRVFWMSIMTATEGSTRATSSTARHAAVNPRPTPPYSSGASIAIRPCSKQAATMSASMAALASIWATRGARTSRAKTSTLSCMLLSSSVVMVHAVIAGAGAEEHMGRREKAGCSACCSLIGEARGPGRRRREDPRTGARVAARRIRCDRKLCGFICAWRSTMPWKETVRGSEAVVPWE
mmetsp:Transcript_12480/g.31351  ORF Transcript_12480/g.31351 Transcript_12480/m.31351 type:complete len:290 (+) Transcript_12480:907-1776(+)